MKTPMVPRSPGERQDRASQAERVHTQFAKGFRWLAWLFAWPALLGGIAAAGDDVPWLREVQVAGATVEPSRPLSPLLPSETAGRKEAWEKRRSELRDAWMAFLGKMPAPPADIAVTSLKRETLDWGTRELVEYEGEPGLRVQA